MLETIRMRLTEKEAILYLQDAGYPLQHSQYHKHKSWLNKHKLERLHFIAAMGFEDQHLERIDTCELIDKLMWQEWKACEDSIQACYDTKGNKGVAAIHQQLL